MTSWEYLMSLNEVCKFTSRETSGKLVSNSELKRWCLNSVLRINGNIMKWDENIPLLITSVTLFTKQNRITLL